MKGPIRVLFAVTAYPVENGGTAGIFHRTLAEALTRRGVSVQVVAPVPRVPGVLRRLNRRWLNYAAIPERYLCNDVKVLRPRYWMWPRGDNLGVTHRAYARLLVREAEKPNLIHAHFAYPCGLAGAEAASVLDVPTVLTLHGSDVNDYPYRSARARRLFGAAVKRATVVLAVSGALAARTEALTGRRPLIAPIGVNLRAYETLPTDRARIRLDLGLPTERRLALFVGALTREKGVPELLAALPDLSNSDDVTGVFLGDGPLRQTVADCEGALALGHVPNERIPLYLRSADVLILPSYSEGMPTVLIEAGAAGTPVVATAVGGIPELLEGGRGVLISPGSGTEVTEAIRRVVREPEQAAGRAHALRDYVGRHYDVDQNAKRLVTLYRDLS